MSKHPRRTGDGRRTRTASPAPGELLRSCGIDSIVLERQTRAHVEQRQRAGLVEHRAVRMFEQWGLGGVLQGFPANNFLEIRIDGRGVSPASVPAGALTVYTHDYGVWWLTVLADAPAPKHAPMTTGERGGWAPRE